MRVTQAEQHPLLLVISLQLKHPNIWAHTERAGQQDADGLVASPCGFGLDQTDAANPSHADVSKWALNAVCCCSPGFWERPTGGLSQTGAAQASATRDHWYVAAVSAGCQFSSGLFFPQFVRSDCVSVWTCYLLSFLFHLFYCFFLQPKHCVHFITYAHVEDPLI